METGLTELSSLLEENKLTKEDCDKQISDTHLEEISRSCCSKWRSLHPYLELQKVVVEDIDRGESKNEEEKRNTFLYTWKQKKGSDATYRKLIGALLKIQSRRDAEIVCKLLQKFVPTQQPTSSPPVKNKPSQPASDTVEVQASKDSEGAGDSNYDIAVNLKELLDYVGITEDKLKRRCSEAHLREIAKEVNNWEIYAPYFLKTKNIDDLKIEFSKPEIQCQRAFLKWKQIQAFKATYRVLVVDVFLKCDNTEMAEFVCNLVK